MRPDVLNGKDLYSAIYACPSRLDFNSEIMERYDVLRVSENVRLFSYFLINNDDNAGNEADDAGDNADD